MRRFTRKMLLPRFRVENDEKQEKFIVKSINKELKKLTGGEHYDFIQMQFFFEGMYKDIPVWEKLTGMKWGSQEKKKSA